MWAPTPEIILPIAGEVGAVVAEPADTDALPARRQLRLCVSMLYTTVLLCTLSIPLGSKQLPISWLVGLAHFGLLAVWTRGAFDLWRLLAFGASLAVITWASAAVHPSFAPTSLIYLAGIYAPLALTLPQLDANALRTVWRHVSTLAAIITVCGLVQVAGQGVAHGLFIDPIRLLPNALLLGQYNTTYEVSSSIPLLKPNGMFLLEPSFFSQFVVLGLLAEMVYFRRTGRVILFMTGLVASFSGTGIVMLLPALAFVGSPRVILGFVLLAALAVAAVAGLGYGDFFLRRATETNETGSSGNARFVAPYQEMTDAWAESGTVCLFGKGAGASERVSTASEANFSPIPKVGLEYGVLGLIGIGALWLGMFWALALPRALLVALLLYYFVVSGSFLQPFTVLSVWAMTAGFLRAHRADDPSPGDTPLPDLSLS